MSSVADTVGSLDHLDGAFLLGGALAGGVGFALGWLLRGRRAPSPEPEPEPELPRLEREVAPAPKSEMRCWPRYETPRTRVVLCRVSAPDERLDGWTLDQSVGGVGLSISAAVELGDVLLIWPENAPDNAPPLRVRVRYCQRHRGRYRVGCQFVSSGAECPEASD